VQQQPHHPGSSPRAAIVKASGPPIVIANPIGAAGARAGPLRLLARGIAPETGGELAPIVKEETGLGAVRR